MARPLVQFGGDRCIAPQTPVCLCSHERRPRRASPEAHSHTSIRSTHATDRGTFEHQHFSGRAAIPHQSVARADSTVAYRSFVVALTRAVAAGVAAGVAAAATEATIAAAVVTGVVTGKVAAGVAAGGAAGVAASVAGGVAVSVAAGTALEGKAPAPPKRAAVARVVAGVVAANLHTPAPMPIARGRAAVA